MPTLTLARATSCSLPAARPNTFANLHEEPARVMGIQSPGGFHRFFGEFVAAMGGDAPDPEVIAPIAARHGATVLGPPLAVSLGMAG